MYTKPYLNDLLCFIHSDDGNDLTLRLIIKPFYVTLNWKSVCHRCHVRDTVEFVIIMAFVLGIVSISSESDL